MNIEHKDAEHERTYFVDDEIIIAKTPALEAELNEFIKKDTRDIIIDLIKATRIDSLFIAVMIRSKKKLTDSGRTLIMTNPSEGIIRVLEVANLDAFFLNP